MKNTIIFLIILSNIIDLQAVNHRMIISTETLVAADQAKTELDHKHETASLHKQQAQEQITAKKDQHEIDIAALKNNIVKLESKITELNQKHAQELIDLQKKHQEQEKTDTKKIQEQELVVVRTQAQLNRISNQAGLEKRGEHWGPGAITGQKEIFENDD